MRPILALFGKSPFGPLAQHAEHVRAAVNLMEPLMRAFLDRDREPTVELYQRISKLEHKADVIKNNIRDHLPKDAADAGRSWRRTAVPEGAGPDSRPRRGPGRAAHDA